ncbi:hypothetical protein [uncultured Roseovarius sp.]|uniref:hypothetical protein n=1 Tax=uncultured Roseovarius sp. TaxID=293344 RepID=UPI0026303156|nr:hypothetical protein [uncultured Roseovarius sp.]
MSIDPNPGPVFVERRAYRRRRLVDAARLLPILGVTLVCLPLLWTGERDAPTSTTYAMIYFFSLWLALVIGAALLSRRLKSEAKSDTADAGADAVGGPAGDK